MRELGTDQAGLQILHLGDCFGLLASAHLGRVGFTERGEVVILPVSFAMDGQDVVFRATAGSKLASAEVGQFVVFEADSYDAAAPSGWSVVVNGLAEIVDAADETARLDGLGLAPWGGTGDPVWVRIRQSSINGRRILADAQAGIGEE
jgi:uncharacterized protein